MASNEEKVVGCALSMWTLFVIAPLWLVIMFGVISRIDAPTWLWIAYWVYTPSLLLGIIMGMAFKALKD